MVTSGPRIRTGGRPVSLAATDPTLPVPLSEGGSEMARGKIARARRLENRKRQGLSKAPALTVPAGAGASGATGLPLSARSDVWSADVATLTEVQYQRGHFWRAPEGDPNTLATYRLPFATNHPPLTAVWRAVTAAAAALCGNTIPPADVPAVRNRVESYYMAARRAYGDEHITVPWEGCSPEEQAHLLAYAEAGDAADNHDEFMSRLVHWTAELVSPERAALMAVRQTLQHNVKCSCGHSLSEHIAGDGPCTHEDGRGTCSCGSYAEAAVEGTDSAPVSRGEATITATRSNTTNTSDALSFTMTFVAEDDCDCSHAKMEHVDGEGECSVKGCDCTSYGEPYESKPEEAASFADVVVTPPAAPVGSGKRWRGLLVPEATLTDDGRAIVPGGITWRELPLSLARMTVTAEGHDGAEVCGRIDVITRVGNDIMGQGVFDDSPIGEETARMVDERVLRGNSVDLAIHEAEVAPKSDYFDADGNWAPKAEADKTPPPESNDLIEALFGEPDEEMILVVHKAVIGMSTVCPFPAFAEAEIELIAGGQMRVTGQAGWIVTSPRETLVAAAPPERLTYPIAPPTEWFDNPELTEPTPLHVSEEGQIWGHVAAWTCHIGIPGQCVKPPRSNTNYRMFHLKEIITEDENGRLVDVACGTLTMDAPHAQRPVNLLDATAHYDHTGTAVADIAVGEDEHGIWMAGALRPDVSAVKARALRGACVSGDWRDLNGNLEMVAVLTVNVPGFPIPKTNARLARVASGELEVVALTAAGVVRQAEKVEVEDEDEEAKLARLVEEAGQPLDEA